jgi:hypothetical protein
MFTSATTRPPKSGREASMPESTTAIVGVAAEVPFAQNFWTPETKGQRCLFERLPASCTGESVVIAAMPFFETRWRIWAPVRFAATPFTEMNWRLMPFARPASPLFSSFLTTEAMAPDCLVGVALNYHVERLRGVRLRRGEQAGRRVRVSGRRARSRGCCQRECDDEHRDETTSGLAPEGALPKLSIRAVVEPHQKFSLSLSLPHQGRKAE